MRFSFLMVLLISAAGRCAAQPADRDVLLKDVGSLPLPDTPGYVCATVGSNEQTQVVATGLTQGQKCPLASIISSRLGNGKLLILGSDHYLQKPLLDNKDVGQFISNTLTWSANTNVPGRKAVQLWGQDRDLAAFLIRKGKKIIIDSNAIHPSTGVLILTRDISDSTQRNNLEIFIRDGGTLIFGSPVADLVRRLNFNYYDAYMNKLFIKAGLYHVYMPFMPADNRGLLQTTVIPSYLQITTLLKAVVSPVFSPATDEMDAYASTIINYLFHNSDTTAVSKEIEKVFISGAHAPIVPTLEHPVIKTAAKDYLRYVVQESLVTKQLYSHPDPGYIHPASSTFPGAVDPAAERVDTTITIQVQPGTLHSTGLYVPAGKKIKILIDAGDQSRQLQARIGIHEDNLQHMDYFTRHETDLTSTFQLAGGPTEIFSSFGGLLLIEAPDTSTLKKTSVQVSGAVRTPYFKLGITDPGEWERTIRDYPGPWAELATDKIILTVPAYRVRKLDDPGKLLRFWDEVMDADAKLAAIPLERTHPERIIIDRQVAWGYMYTALKKIVAPDDASCALMLDETLMRKEGSWGHFHELGHRHQFWGIDFTGLGEVTANLYTMYVYDKVLHKGLYNHENIPDKQTVIESIKKYMADKPDFDKFCSDPFLALKMYIEIIENFGWQSIEQVFSTYRLLPPDRYPATEAGKRDYWFTCICAATGKDLSGFFDKWQIPITGKAKASVKSYPGWLPEELK
ncbi:MAG: M60 family metallopeptidase [Chitinophagaceae bacterium]|nr:M60 family metallopeptidase [Chitinophagaceae bacterium]